MGQINVRKRGNVYEYFFEGAKVNNKRTRISKSGFRTDSLMLGNIKISQILSIILSIIFGSILLYKKVKKWS